MTVQLLPKRAMLTQTTRPKRRPDVIRRAQPMQGCCDAEVTGRPGVGIGAGGTKDGMCRTPRGRDGRARDVCLGVLRGGKSGRPSAAEGAVKEQRA